MTDREWAFRIHDAMHSTKGFTTWNSDASDAIDAFRAEVLKEAADKAAFLRNEVANLRVALEDCLDEMEAVSKLIRGDELFHATLARGRALLWNMIDCPTCAESVEPPGSNELLKQHGVSYSHSIERGCKTCKHQDRYDMMFPCSACYPSNWIKWMPKDPCPTCAESVDNQKATK